MAKGQYIRIYHELKDEYPSVWRSDVQLGAFVRLLLIADKWWPQWAPVSHRNGAYRSLLECGLIILWGGVMTDRETRSWCISCERDMAEDEVKAHYKSEEHRRRLLPPLATHRPLPDGRIEITPRPAESEGCYHGAPHRCSRCGFEWP